MQETRCRLGDAGLGLELRSHVAKSTVLYIDHR